jgi:2-oxoglutarate ferredoxin oxidoreductase subunit alpha
VRGDGVIKVNQLAIKLATVNGTGSASANGLLMQAIFRMGIPVSGKNVFPSNIQGLPTWYEIRVDRHGYTARVREFDIVVAMNAESYGRDVAEVRPGGYLVYDSSWPLDTALSRDDITFLGVPLARMCNENFEGARERILMKNIAYVGVLAALIEVDLDVVDTMLRERFGKKEHLMDSNLHAIRLGFEFARENVECPLPVRLEKMDATRDAIMIDGNTAAALGCVYAGATVGAWYPITPATSLMDAFLRFCERYRENGESGERRYCVVQAEDELAAAGVAIGAGWMGARAFTPTSGPGISLMSEFIGLAYYTEVPAVFFNIQRTGPSTGMPTRTQQGDLQLVVYASHGDTKHIALFPADPRECFELTVNAFDLADRYQTPVFVVSDLDIGMNDWMCERFEWHDEYQPDRGKILSSEELQQLETFYRYLDVDGDGVCARTLPGTHPKGAYFARGSGHDRYGRYTEDAEEYVDVVDRLTRKFELAAEHLPEPIIDLAPGSNLGIITIGSCAAAVREAIDRLAQEGVSASLLRVRSFPFSAAVKEFLEAHEQLVVVEMNRDGQLRRLLMLETGVPEHRMRSIRYYGGFPMTADQVVAGVMKELEGVRT